MAVFQILETRNLKSLSFATGIGCKRHYLSMPVSGPPESPPPDPHLPPNFPLCPQLPLSAPNPKSRIKENMGRYLDSHFPRYSPYLYYLPPISPICHLFTLYGFPFCHLLPPYCTISSESSISAGAFLLLTPSISFHPMLSNALLILTPPSRPFPLHPQFPSPFSLLFAQTRPVH